MPVGQFFLEGVFMEQEVWKDIKGYGKAYQISNYGRVKTFINSQGNPTPGRLRKLNKNYRGYYSVSLTLNKKYRHTRISRLVAEHFIPNPLNKPEVNHKDGVKANNHYTNLEWNTRSENMIHAHKILKINKVMGESLWMSKLTAGQVREIRGRYQFRKFGCCKLAHIYNVDPSCIWLIVNNKNWKHIV